MSSFFSLLVRFPLSFAGFLLFVSVLVSLPGGWSFRIRLGYSVCVVFFAGLAYVKLWEKIQEAIKIRRYEKRYENVYVASRHPKTGEEIDLGEDLNELVVWSDYTEVLETVKDEKEWLVRAGNEWLAEDLVAEVRVQVVPIIFRDGGYINENWEENFPERLELLIREDRANRHATLKEKAPVWYDQFANYQSGVKYEKAKTI